MFYKLDGELLEASTVEAPDFSLNEASMSEYTLPMGDWYYFPTIEEAKTYFGIVEEA